MQVCRSARPPRISEWRAAEPEREQRIRNLRALAPGALAQGIASGLPPAQVVSNVEALLGAAITLLRWLPERCKCGLGLGSDALDGVDMASATMPEMNSWEIETPADAYALDKEQRSAKAQLRAQAAEWREQDNRQLESLLTAFNTEVEQCGWVAALADAHTAPAHVGDALSAAPLKHADGPEAGCYLWWNGIKHNIPAGVVYRLIARMWTREFAKYDDLMGSPDPDVWVWEAPVDPQSVRSALCKASAVLARVGVPWKLSADSRERVIRKVARENP